VRALACFAIGLAIPSDSCGGDLKPYPLPPEARTGIEKLAASIEYYSGGFFNEGKVQSIRKRPLEHAVIRSASQSGCSLELSLPVATPATFLSAKPGSRDDQAAKSRADGDR
jgi:hypothetical protein